MIQSTCQVEVPDRVFQATRGVVIPKPAASWKAVRWTLWGIAINVAALAVFWLWMGLAARK